LRCYQHRFGPLTFNHTISAFIDLFYRPSISAYGWAWRPAVLEDLFVSIMMLDAQSLPIAFIPELHWIAFVRLYVVNHCGRRDAALLLAHHA
jgi:hypothetical protein